MLYYFTSSFWIILHVFYLFLPNQPLQEAKKVVLSVRDTYLQQTIAPLLPTCSIL